MNMKQHNRLSVKSAIFHDCVFTSSKNFEHSVNQPNKHFTLVLLKTKLLSYEEQIVDSVSMRLTALVFSKMSRQLLDGLPCHLVQAFVYIYFCNTSHLLFSIHFVSKLQHKSLKDTEV